MERVIAFLLVITLQLHACSAALQRSGPNHLKGPCTRTSYGCFKDKGPDEDSRAIKGGIRFTTGDYTKLLDLCEAYAMMNGWTTYGVEGTHERHIQKQCFTGNKEQTKTYNFYLPADFNSDLKCHDGLGGPWTLNVYGIRYCDSVTDYFLRKHKGCFKDKGSDRIMTERVSNDLKMQGNDNEIIKLCESYARLKGYPYFGIESFQECYFSRDANLEYDRHGDSHSCVNGIGGTFAMNVYQIIGDWPATDRFVRSWKDTNLCPPNSVKITNKDDCRLAKSITEKTWKSDERPSTLVPDGCVAHHYLDDLNHNIVFFNDINGKVGGSHYRYSPICQIQDSGKYNVYDGDCSGGLQSEDSVGKTRHTDMDCEERCLNDLNCAGFSFKIPFYSTYGEKECWTYSAILAEGDGARNKRCYMKKFAENYERSTGPCRGGLQPDDAAGRSMIKRSPLDCETICSNDPECYSFFLNFLHPDTCFTYTSPFSKGDSTITSYGRCFTKKLNYELSYGGCENVMSPGSSAGVTYQDNRDCKAYCDAEPSCSAFAWNTSESYEHQGCWKYTSKYAKGTKSSSDAICATKTYG